MSRPDLTTSRQIELERQREGLRAIRARRIGAQLELVERCCFLEFALLAIGLAITSSLPAAAVPTVLAITTTLGARSRH